jgi:hypothetical protein
MQPGQKRMKAHRRTVLERVFHRLFTWIGALGRLAA